MRGQALLPLTAATLLGVLAGLGTFTFVYGDGTAYLSDDPEACGNCHVMDGHLDSWSAASHARVAVCNDCHLPPDVVAKWVTKADNGLLHTLAFTTGAFHEPIRIKPRNARRTQAACLECHGELVHALKPARSDREALACVHCHSDVGHAGR